jgi:hypothetical protein
LYPAVPKAQDLPSAIQAINALTQIILKLASPGLPPFQNNLAPFTPAKLVGTPGINAALAHAGSPGGSFAMDGSKGKEAEEPYWRPTEVKTEIVKVKNSEDEEQFVIVKRIISLTFTDQTNPDSTITFKMKEL